jgi:hypothetical protein
MTRDIDTVLDEETESRGLAIVVLVGQLVMAG